MAKQVLEHDPLTGITTWFEYTAEDKMLITETQDVSAILEHNQTLRNNEDYSKRGIKDDMWHYARVPLTVMMDIKTRFGVDLMSPKVDWKSAFKIINREYPYLKTTTKTHA